MTPLRLGLLYGLGAFAFIAGYLNLMMGDWPSWYRLARQGRQAVATVTRVEPHEHQRCHFEYSVNATLYQGLTDGCQAEVGDVLTVWYSPGNPSFVTVKAPAHELSVQLTGSVVMAVVVGVAAAFRTWRRKRSTVDKGAAQRCVGADEAR